MPLWRQSWISQGVDAPVHPVPFLLRVRCRLSTEESSIFPRKPFSLQIPKQRGRGIYIYMYVCIPLYIILVVPVYFNPRVFSRKLHACSCYHANPSLLWMEKPQVWHFTPIGSTGYLDPQKTRFDLALYLFFFWGKGNKNESVFWGSR